MAQVNREKLKDYFKSGSRPTEEEFTSFIESVPNIIDDGEFRKSQDGWIFYPSPDGDTVLQIFADKPDIENSFLPLWSIVLGKDKNLSIRNEEAQPIVDIYPDKAVKINRDLRIEGKVFASSFAGTCGLSDENKLYGTLPADGNWYTIPIKKEGEKDGCRIYHISAGCGNIAKNRYALLEATVMHAFGKKRKIHRLNSWTGWRLNRLKIRWQDTGEGMQLQLRTRRNYGSATHIRYQITERWGDYYMNAEI